MWRTLTVLSATCFTFNGWADESASYAEPPLTERDRAFWAFVPPQAHELPVPGETPIDAFLLASLREKGLPDFAPPARPEALLRRVTFDLTGLPPTPRQVDAFLSAASRDPDDALRALVEECLASPHYGERWAQHWLDLARFAETDGFEFDAVREEAWKYRDWVVRAFNDDLPYDRFVSLQIAGDLLEPGNAESAAATGFLLCGPDMPDLNLQEERRHLVLNGLTGTIGSVFLGVTLECAECHDHKNDPFSQADFYRLRAVFEDFSLPEKKKSLPLVFPVGERTSARLYQRGDFRRPSLAIDPALPKILGASGLPDAAEPRLALATGLTRPGHPLTARVIVNRVWQHHFGTGLVATASDFGKLGERPTHPELLDWLALEFVKHGWSLKWLHREILASRAWQQQSYNSTADPLWEQRHVIDPENLLVSRRDRLRLDGEAVRDAMLLAADRLNLRAGGPGVRPPLPPEVAVTLLKNQWPVTADATQHDRRSLYLFARRNLRYPLFEVLDRPDANQSCPRRHVSTTAPQALTLLNDAFVNDLAGSLAGRLAEGPDGIDEAFVRVLGRHPAAAELADAQAFLREAPREALVLALFNLNEFIHLD